MERETILHLLIACGFLGVLCSAQEVHAEEALLSVPLETPLLEKLFSVTAPVPESNFSPTHDGIESPSAEAPPDDGNWPSALPGGREAVLARLQGKFSVGKRADGIIYHPGATLTFRTGKGLQNYMGWEKREDNPLFLTEEEKIALEFEFAEKITEQVQTFPIPLIGNVLAGCLQIGHHVDNVTKGIRKKYRLHLNYSEKTFRAAYKESF